MGNKETLCDMGYEDAVIFKNPDYDSAIIGVSNYGRVVYSYNLMVEYLILVEGMTEDEAVDFIDYNTLSTVGSVETAPIVMYDLI